MNRENDYKGGVLTDSDYHNEELYKSIIVNWEDTEFAPANQIQPASIDLRLSETIWRQKRRGFGKNVIDTGKDSRVNFDPEDVWREDVISVKKPLVIKPGEMVLARITEKLRIPDDCIGLIVGKSSFSRLGLSVACSPFCNPGYLGNYPLQLYNACTKSIVLYPNMNICQLICIKLNGTVALPYYDAARKATNAKDDDGAPDKYWMSKNLSSLKKSLDEYPAATKLMKSIEKEIDSKELYDTEYERDKNLRLIYSRLITYHNKGKSMKLSDFAAEERACAERLGTWPKIAGALLGLAGVGSFAVTFIKEIVSDSTAKTVLLTVAALLIAGCAVMFLSKKMWSSLTRKIESMEWAKKSK